MGSIKNTKCSFCAKNKKEVNILISGQGAYICDTCILQAAQIIKPEKSTNVAMAIRGILILGDLNPK